MSSEKLAWVGQKLSGGRYHVESLLGEGGMGHVYRARDKNLDADVVIKVPRRSLLDDPGFAHRFAHEVRSLVRLSHPHIVKVTDVGTHGDLPFAIMQYLPGGNLEDRRPLGPAGVPVPADPASLEAWLPDIAAALDYVHAKGYVHRDVKPANILFDAEGHAFLSDFGVTKALASGEGRSRATTAAGLVLGTPEYMAPELIMGEPFDGRADQYALAITVYELLAGRRPFDGPTTASILVQQTTKEPPNLGSLRLRINERLTAAVHRGVAKEPGQRFSDSVAFAREVIAGSLNPTTHVQARSTVSKETLKTFERSRTARKSSAAAQSASIWSETEDTSQPDPETPSEKNGRTKRFSGDGRRSAKVVFVTAVLLSVVGLGGLIRHGVVNRSKNVNLQSKKSPFLKESDVQDPQNAAKETAPVAPILTVSEGSGTDKRPKEEVRGAGLEEKKKDSPPSLMEIKDLAVDANTPIDFTATLSTPRSTGDVAYSLVNPPDGAVIHEKSGRFTWKPAVTQAGKTFGIVVRVESLVSKGSTSEKAFNIQIKPHTGEVRQFTGLVGEVTGVGLSPDGRFALACGENKSVCLWDASSGKLLRRKNVGCAPTNVIFSPDSALVAVSDGKNAMILRTESLEIIRRFSAYSESINESLISADGQVVLSLRGQSIVESFDTKTGNLLALLEGHSGPVRAIALSKNGRVALSGGNDKSVRLWNTSDGKELKPLGGHQGAVICVCLSEDGRLALSGGEDKTVRLWEIESGRELHAFKIAQIPTMVGLSINRVEPAVVVVIGQKPPGGREIIRFDIYKQLQDKSKMSEPGLNEFTHVTFLEVPQLIRFVNNNLIYVGESKDKIKSLNQFHVLSLTLTKIFDTAKYLFNNNVDRIAPLFRKNDLNYYQTDNFIFSYCDNRPYFGKMYATKGSCTFVNYESAKVASLKLNPRSPERLDYGGAPPLGILTSLTASLESDLVVSGDNAGTLTLWDVKAAKQTRHLMISPKYEFKILGNFTSASLSTGQQKIRFDIKNGFSNTLIKKSTSRNFKDTSNLEWLTQGLDGSPCALDVSEDGIRKNNDDDRTKVYLAKRNEIYLYQELMMSTGVSKEDRLPKVFTGHTGQIRSLALAPEVHRIVSCGNDATIRLWNIESGREIVCFLGHNGPVKFVSSSADGKYVLSAGEDKTVRLWAWNPRDAK